MSEDSVTDTKERGPEVHQADPVGPQGTALILELQRIQRAFDQEFRRDPRKPVRQPHHDSARAAQSRHPAPRRKKRKGMVKRAVDACLNGFGLANAHRADAGAAKGRPAAARDTHKPVRPPRQERAADHGLAVQRARNGRPPPSRSPGLEQADVHVLPTRSSKAVPAPSSSRPLRLEHADGSGGERAQPAPAPHGSAGMAKTQPSISALKLLARELQQELAREQSRVEDIVDEPERQTSEMALKSAFDQTLDRCADHAKIRYRLKSSLGRALERCADHAKLGYRLLFKGEEVTEENASRAELATRITRSFERELRTGLRVLVFGLGAVGGWGTLVPLSGAVAVTGSLVVQSDIKKVQHPTGGIVAQIPVQDGMHVNAGDLVIRLDETQARANLQMISSQLDEVLIRIARLTAERDGSDEPKMPPELTDRSGDEDVGARFASEKSLFKARANTRQSQKELLQSRIVQLGQQIDGLEAQIKSNASQSDLIAGELQGVQKLYDQRLAPITRLNSLQRDAARLEGERGQLQSTIAETKSKIGEAQLQLIRVDQDFRADVLKDLREAEGKRAELAERRVAAQDQVNRIEIRAPTSGIVHQLAAHTVGGVIKAGEVVMEIVPDRDELQVEAHLPPKDIDQVKVGQPTLVRFSAFNQRTTPQLKGVVSYVSADLTREQHSNASYYTVKVTLPEEEHRRLAGLQLVSGMPADIFVQTGSRTMMSYLMKPITEQLRRAFNER